jgi:hypothetical protein
MENNNGYNGNQGGGPRSGVDVGQIFSNLLAEANRRRIVLRHEGETVLRLPLTIAVIIGLVLLWKSPFLTVLIIGLIFFLRVQVVFERRSNVRPPGPRGN